MIGSVNEVVPQWKTTRDYGSWRPSGCSSGMGAGMADRNATRQDLSNAVQKKTGVSRVESVHMVVQVLGEISERLEAGEEVKLSGFGTFKVRDKGE